MAADFATIDGPTRSEEADEDEGKPTLDDDDDSKKAFLPFDKRCAC